MTDSDGPGVELGDGWAVGSLEALGEGYGFRTVRRELGVTAFGPGGPPAIPGAPDAEQAGGGG